MRLAALLLSLGAAVGGTAGPVAVYAQATTAPALPSFRDEFLGQFDGSMEKLIALAEAIPADKFSWAPGTGRGSRWRAEPVLLLCDGACDPFGGGCEPAKAPENFFWEWISVRKNARRDLIQPCCGV